VLDIMPVGRTALWCIACLLTRVESKSVAVIGGGIGGATAALELLVHPGAPDVTLFEAHATIGNPKSASGIIAASLIFNSQSQYWHTFDDADDIISKMKTQVVNPTKRQLQFAARGARYKLQKDPRSVKANKKKFFEASRLRLEYMVNQYPELCGAIVGPYCCKGKGKARAWMDEKGECEKKPCGWAHTFFTADDWKFADDADKAKTSGWQIEAKGSDRLGEAEAFLFEKDLAGVLWNDVDEGFIRVEDLFPIMAKIFADSKRVKVLPNCKVDSIAKASQAPKGEGTRRLGKGSLKASSVEAGPLTVSFAGGNNTHCGDDSEHVFDSIIVSAGANSVNVLAPQDELMPEELIPVKGFACATNSPLIKKNLLDLGVQYEEMSHYIRPQKNGGVRYGFGKEWGGLDTEVSQIDPHFEEKWATKAEGIIATGLGRKVMAQKDVQKLAGIRPLSALGNFPLIKTYPKWPGLILATGYGWHGFVMSWKSGQIAADLAVTGSVGEAAWIMAVEDYTGCTAWSPRCWAWYSWAALGVVVALLGFCCFKLCCGGSSGGMTRPQE